MNQPLLIKNKWLLKSIFFLLIWVISTTLFGQTISSVTSPSGNGTYKEGDVINLRVTYDASVDVTLGSGITFLVETGSSDGVATYQDGDQTNVTQLNFTYTVGLGHMSLDLDQEASNTLVLASGAAIKANGTSTDASLTLPGSPNNLANTQDIVVDGIPPSGYTVSIDQALINSGNETAHSFTFAGAEVGATYNYSIDDTNGGTLAVTGSGTIVTATDQITSIDVSSLDDDNLTLTVYLTDAAGNQGGDVTDNVIKDATAPNGYVVSIDQAFINNGNKTALSFTFSGAEIGATYNYSIDDTNGGTLAVTGSGTIVTANDQITGIDVSSLDDDILTLTVYLTDVNSNQGGDVTDNVTKDIVAPNGYAISIDQAFANSGNETAMSFTFSGAEVGATYNYSIDDTNGGTPAVTGSGTIVTATDQITSIDVSSLNDDNLTFTVYLTDPAGNQGGNATDNVIKETVPPSGYTVSIDQATITPANETSLSFTFAGAEVGTDYNYSIDDTNGGTSAVIGTGTIVTATDQITGIDVSSLDDDNLTLTVYLTDAAGNQGGNTTDNVIKDTTPPNGYTVSFDQAYANISTEGSMSFTFAGAEVGADYNYSIDDSNGGTPAVTGSGTIVTANDQITSIDVSSLDDDNLTLTVYLTDAAGNQGGNTTDNITKDTVRPTLLGAVSLVRQNPGVETIYLQISEDITLADGASVIFATPNTSNPGIQVWDGNDDTAIGSATYENDGTYTRTLVIVSAANNSKWYTAAQSANTSQVLYTAGGNIFDLAGNEFILPATDVTSGDLVPPTVNPDVMTLYPRAGSPEKIVFTLDDNPTFINNNDVQGFATSTGTIASATYNTSTQEVTLTSSANGDWTSGTTVNYSQTTPIDGNVTDDNGNEMADITGHVVVVETAPPVITNVSIPNAPMNVGDVVVATISVQDDDGDVPVLTSGSIGGYTLGSFTGTGPTSYTATFTVTEGGNSYSAGSNIPIANLVLTDGQGNASPTYSTPISQAGDLIDATSPQVTSITRASTVNSWSTTGGTSATSVDFTVTFSEAVSGVDLSDFTLTTTGSITGALLAGISGSGDTYTITVNSYINNGTIRIDYVDNGTVFDTPGGNPIVGAGAIPDGSYSFGEIYSIVLAEPSNHILGLSATPVNSTSINLSWTNPNLPAQPATQYLIVVDGPDDDDMPGTPATVQDGVLVTNDFDFSDGNGAVVISSALTNYSFNTLLSGKSYNFQVFPLTSSTDYSDDNINYKGRTGAVDDGGVPSISMSTPTAATGTITAGTSTEPVTLSSLSTSYGSDVVLDFKITDDGASPASDNAKLKFTQLVITAGAGNTVTNWSDVIAQAELKDITENNTVTTTTIGTNSITFSGLNNGNNKEAEIDDNEVKEYRLRVKFKSTMTGAAPETIDGQRFVFELKESGITYKDASSSTIYSLESEDSDPGAGGINNTVTVDATELNWTTQPQSTIGVLNTFGVAPVATAQDANGNRDLDFNTAITLTNVGAISMNNVPTAFSAGQLTLSSLTYSDAGDGSLTVNAGLVSPASNLVTVSYSDNTKITAGASVEPATISSLTTVAAGAQVFDITIQDDDAVGLTINDNVPTRLNQITFNAATLGGSELETYWSDVIENALLYDGASLYFVKPFTGYPNGGSIGTSSITFNSLPDTNPGDIGYIDDGTSKTYYLYIWLKTTVTNGLNETIDNKHFNFDIDGADITVEAYSSTMNLASPTITSGVGNNEIVVNATQLTFNQQPTTTFINEVMAPAVEISTTDVNGNIDLDQNGVLVNITSSGTMSPSTVNATISNGVGTAGNIVHTIITNGSPINLTATDNAAILTQSISDPFDILPGSAESDITTTAMTYSTNIAYKDFVNASVSNSDLKVFQFDINDGTSGGTATDIDGLPTYVTSLSFDITNSNVLQTIGLFDNTDALIAQVASAPTITFDLTGSPLIIPDDGAVTYHLRTTFSTTVTDNAQFVFTVSGAVANDQGSSFESVDGAPTAGSAATSSISGDENRIEVLATQLVYTTPHPSSVSIDTPYGTLGSSSPILEAQDANSNLDIDFDLAISFSNYSATLSTALGTTPSTVTGDFAGGIYAYDSNFEFDDDSQGNSDVVITISTAAGNNSNGDSYPLLTIDTPGFEVSAAESSLITLDSNHSSFNYIDYDAPAGNFPSNNYDILANFIILDEDVVPTFNPVSDKNDIAPTTLTNLEINVTNYENIKEIALYDGTDFYYGTDVGSGNFTFTGFSIVAEDLESGGGATGMATFSIAASYESTLQSPLTDDGEELQVTIVNAVGVGSKFDDSDDVGDNDAGGSIGVAQTPGGSNIFNVEATLLNVSIQPASIEGINIPITEPEIQAIDANGGLDLDFNYAATVNAATTVANTPTNFSNGVLSFVGFVYTGTGDGTLSIISNGLNVSSDPVDVIHTTVTNLDIGGTSTETNNGIAPQSILPAGALNRAIIGFSITANQNTVSEPTLNEITIDFGNPITGVIENIRLFRSADSDYVTLPNTDLTGGVTITPGIDFINITGLADEITSTSSVRNYFLVVDISDNANFSTPPLTPQLVATGVPNGNIILTSGSVDANIIGRTYTFNDINNPIVTDRVPAAGNSNFPLSDPIELQFGEKVIPQPDDSLMISIYKYLDDVLIGDYKLDKTQTIDSARFFFNTNGDLVGDTKYYITVDPGDAGDDGVIPGPIINGNSGFVDKSGNPFAGYTSKTNWSFTTSDNVDPVFDPDKLPLVTYITDVGFDIKVALDEPGTVYYIVVDPDVTTGTPAVNEIRNGTFGGTLATGQADIIKGFEYHYISVLNSSVFPTPAGPDSNFRVWLTAEDVALPTPNQMDEGTQVMIDDTFTSAPGAVEVQTTTEDICKGDAQIILSPIYIIESSDNDFTGSGETINFYLSDEFSFDVNSTSANIYGQGGDLTVDSWSYLNSSILQVVYSAPSSSNRDKLVISNLAIKAANDNSVGTTGSLVRLGGTGLTTEFPDLTLIASFNTYQIPEITFETDPTGTTVGNNEEKIALIPDPLNTNILLGIGTTTFTGNGIVGDTLYTEGLPLNTPNEILFEYKDEYGCSVTSSKEITIFDASQAIIGLDNIQCTDALPDVIEVNGRAPQFLLIDLQVSIPSDQTGAFDPAVVNNSLATNGSGDYEFNPGLFNTLGNYALFPTNEGGLIGTLVFTGQYQDQQNTAIIEVLEQRVDIYIPPVSELTFLDEGSVFPEEYCENDSDIRLDGSPKPATGVSVGFFTINNDPNHPALNDNGDGSATIDALIAGQQGYGFIDVSYIFQNSLSGCDSTVTKTIRINPNPIASFTNKPGCVDADFNFEDTSEFPNNTPSPDPVTGSVIDSWNWNFDDLDNLGSPNNSTNQFATHVFESSGTYNVTLTVETDRGCFSNEVSEPISIGNNPVTQFYFEQVSKDTPTKLTNTTPADVNAVLDSMAWTIDGVFESGYKTGLFDTYEYTFTTEGLHQVILTTVTDKQCAINDTLDFFIVPKYTLDTSDGDVANDSHEDNFESGSEGWVDWGTNSSWTIGSSGGDIITSGDGDFWTTGLNAPHNTDEVSYVYSPVYNVADLDKPLITLMKFTDLQTSNGVIIEYTPVSLHGNSKTGIDNADWHLLGTSETGFNWYNGDAIDNVGGDQPTKRYGWTETDQGWLEAKHSLSSVKNEALANGGDIQFRISFVSGSLNTNGFDGFGFDDFTIGSRTRTVLLENFINAAIDDNNVTFDENDSINTFLGSSPELAVLEYHPNIGGTTDPINNSPDADARALYYGIGTTPRVAVDGIRNPNKVFSEWAIPAYEVQSLSIVKLDISTLVQSDGSDIEIISTLRAKEDIPANYVVHVAIVENQVSINGGTNSGISQFSNVVRKMLPNAAGTKFSTILAKGDTKVITNGWFPSVAFEPGDYSIIVFVQDEASKEIYQAEVITPTIGTVTGIEDNLNEAGITVYPNPSNNYFTLELGKDVDVDTDVHIFNQVGQVIHSSQIQIGNKSVQINSSLWVPGIYYVQTEFDGEPLRKRIIIQHK